MTDGTLNRYTRSTARQFLPVSFRALIIASAYWVLSLSLTGLSGSIAAILGCFTACVAADALFERSVLRHSRTPVILAGCGLLLLGGLSLSSGLTGSSILVGLLSPMAGYQSAEFFQVVSYQCICDFQFTGLVAAL